MKHRQNALDAIRSHGGFTRNDGGDCVVFELGNKRFMLEDSDGPTVSQFSDAIHRLTGFSALCARVGSEREKVADAALWLWNNRGLTAESNSFKAPGSTILQIVGTCQEADAKKAAVIDLDALAWGQIKEAASQSAWMPPEYMMNDWVSDVCAFLREPRQ